MINAIFLCAFTLIWRFMVENESLSDYDVFLVLSHSHHKQYSAGWRFKCDVNLGFVEFKQNNF